MPDGEFDVILADPPWHYHGRAVHPRDQILNKYPTMMTQAIATLTIPAADNAACFMWSTAAHLPDALQVMEAWGFEYKTFAVWVKPKIGLGYWMRMHHEPLLLGIRGTMSLDIRSERDSVIFADKRGHSVKPPEVYKLIESMFPGRRCLELFARNSRHGWTAWGTGEAKKDRQLTLFEESIT